MITKNEPSCQICGSTNIGQLRPASFVRLEILDEIKREHNNWNVDGWICDRDFDKYRNVYIERLITEASGEISQLEQTVLTSLKENEILAKNPEEINTKSLNFADRLADQMAAFGGSWAFIILFIIIVAAWIFINTTLLTTNSFDPFPFIFLNLVLSCIAAIQAPIIMMSQNRQEVRDQQKAMQDYKVNLKAELEIRQLQQKIDHLLRYQWQRLLEIQKVQMELMEEIQKK